MTIGLGEVAAARKIHVPDGRVAEWEAGDRQPTIAQLRVAATAYKRPPGVLFLPAPPREFDTMRDFRRLPGSVSGDWSPELHGEYRRARAQRESLLELAEVEDLAPVTSWRLSSVPDEIETLASAARSALLALTPVPLPSGAATSHEHLNSWIAAPEEAGVLVMATARGGVSTTEMRAFSLYFDVLPVIMVNGSDYI